MTTTSQASLEYAALAEVSRASLIVEQAYRAARNRLDVTAVALDRAIADCSTLPTAEREIRLEAAVSSWADAVTAMDAIGISAFAE